MLDTGWMRIVAWNGNWKSKRSTVEAQVAAVCALHADVAIFSGGVPMRLERSRVGRLGEAVPISEARYSMQLVFRSGDVPEHESNHQAMDDIRRLYWGQLAAATRPIVKASTVPPTFAAGSWLEFRRRIGPHPHWSSPA